MKGEPEKGAENETEPGAITSCETARESSAKAHHLWEPE